MSFLLGLFLFIIIWGNGCYTPDVVVKPGFRLSSVKTISVVPIKDYQSFPGSGEIISRSLVHHLMKIGFNVIEREKLNVVMEEAALSQAVTAEKNPPLNIGTPDALILCTITEFNDKQVIVIPVTTHDKGKIVTSVEEKSEPIVLGKEEKGEEKIIYETTTTEQTTHYQGSTTETSRVEYINSVVGITLQMVDKETGDVLWSSNYWYNALNLHNAVDKCVKGALKPLKILLKKSNLLQRKI